MSGHDDAFADALRAWLAHQAMAEERLTSFAFHEGQGAIDLAAPSSQEALGRWILGVVAAADVAAFLGSVDGPGRTMTELSEGGAFGLDRGDRVAVAARVGVLAAAGLVTRELEADRVGLTALGRAALDAISVHEHAERRPAATGRPR